MKQLDQIKILIKSYASIINLEDDREVCQLIADIQSLIREEVEHE